MRTLSTHAHTQVARIAEQLGFSAQAVETMLDALVAGNGSMAQFDHPDFGGAGQWMRGGMVMTGDLRDHGLKGRIDRLCTTLAEWIAREPDLSERGSFQRQSQSGGGLASVQDSRDPDHEAGATSGRTAWWPRSLGTPDSAGTQNDVRYAWFSRPRRLAIETGGKLVVYDTGDHRIGGVSQQQGGRSSLSFTSQHGTLDLGQLPVVSATKPDDEVDDVPLPAAKGSPATPDARGDPFEALEKLAQLHARGVVSDAEFEAKKAELLARI